VNSHFAAAEKENFLGVKNLPQLQIVNMGRNLVPASMPDKGNLLGEIGGGEKLDARLIVF
jgi:hypothetical protein